MTNKQISVYVREDQFSRIKKLPREINLSEHLRRCIDKILEQQEKKVDNDQ